MSEKEKMSIEELDQVVGGGKDSDVDSKSLEELFEKHRSGPYKCNICGKEYYLGDEEKPRSVCLECWQKPNPLV